MKLLIKQARIIDPDSPLHDRSAAIFIEDGMIRRLAPSLDIAADQVIDIPGLHVSPGWVDCFANFADPGYEFKETLESGAMAAARGGYTDVMIIPNTNPVLHNKSSVEYIKHKSVSFPVSIHPIGAVTRNAAGNELAEMYDMRSSGALAFSDGLNCVQSAGLLVKALQYVKAFGGTIIQLPDDKSINPHGLMTEGIVSTQLGLPGKPEMAEELIVARDIKLARYAGSRLHFTGITTAKSVEYIGRAKASGTAISCSVSPAHLFFNDEDLQGYNTHLKINPPLRSRQQQKALQEAVTKGAIDCLASHHLPHEYDSKIVEFEYAKFGMTAIETSFAAARTALPDVPVATWVSMLAINPRRLFGLPPASIAENTAACLTLFNPDERWTVEEGSFRSKSRNSPFTGKELVGKAIGIINGKKIHLA